MRDPAFEDGMSFECRTQTYLQVCNKWKNKGETVRSKMCLTAADARKSWQMQSRQRKIKWNVTIAVVDDGGFLVHLERLDGAPAQSARIATCKAQTSAATARTPTKALEDIVKDTAGDGCVPRQGSGSGRSSDHRIRVSVWERWEFPAPNPMKMSKWPAPDLKRSSSSRFLEFSSAGFSLRGFVLARTKTHRLKPMPPTPTSLWDSLQ